jgi:tetratricopeptide (TPR) repeat protein
VARGHTDQAFATYQKSIQNSPRDVRGYVLLAELEDSQGRWQKAQELYQKALQVQSDYPPAANNLAFLMLEHGQNTDVAMSLAQVARRGLPNSPAAADTMAWAYYHKSAYRSALDLLQEASRQSPKDPSIHYHLGLAYQKVGDMPHAKQELERVLQTDPKFSHSDDIRQSLAQLNQR